MTSSKSAIDREELIKLGGEIAKLVKNKKDHLRCVLCVLTTEDDNILIAHGNTGEIIDRVTMSIERLADNARGGVILQGEIRDPNGKVVAGVSKEGH